MLASSKSNGATASEDVGEAPTWATHKLRALVDAPSPAESPALLSAIREIAPLVSASGNTPAARRSLRPALSARAVDRSAAVLASFAPAQAALAAVQLHVASMQADVSALSARLAAARTGAGAVVAQTGALRRQLDAARRKGDVSRAFVSRFAVAQEEKDALQAGVVDAQFLTALARLEQVHREARALLRSRHQRAGLEAIEFAATAREEAYEKVLRFVQARCGTLDVDAEEHEKEAALLRNAIRALKARPMLLRLCSEEVASARRASLVSRFVAALTVGGPGGMPRPIEIHAHDPMRYTNDMLAWIHQSLASEKELMFRLFATTEQPLRAMGAFATANDEDVAGGDGDEERVREHNDDLALKVLNTVFDALCRPFRIRFEQALEHQLPVVVLYRLASLLEFYAATMGQLLGPGAALPEMLMECNSVAMYAFFSAWKAKMSAFRDSGVSPSDELTPPLAVHQSMTRLDEIMATLDASLVPKDARQGQIGAILEVILNPLLALCDTMSCKSLSPLEARVFLANSIDAMRIPLAAYSFAAHRVESLTVVADEHIDEYIRLSSVAVLRRCGLSERIRILNDAKAARKLSSESIEVVDENDIKPAAPEESGTSLEDEKERIRRASRPLSQQPGMDIESLSISVKNFYAMLFGGAGLGSGLDALSPPAVTRITNVRARHRAKDAVAKVLSDAHGDIVAAVGDSYNEYGPDAASVIGLRDADKVALVLTGH